MSENTVDPKTERLHRNYFSSGPIEDSLSKLNVDITRLMGAKLDRRILVQKVLRDWLAWWDTGEVKTADLFAEIKEEGD